MTSLVGEELATTCAHIQQMPEALRSLWFQGARFLGKAAVGGALGLAIAVPVSEYWTSDIQVGPHRAGLTATFDGKIIANEGALGGAELPSPAPFGVGARIQLEEAITPPGLDIASQYVALLESPQGEITNIGNELKKQLLRSGVVGLLLGEVFAFGGFNVARSMRRQGRHPVFAYGAMMATTAAVATSCSVVPNYIHQDIAPAPWQSLESILRPEVYRALPKPLRDVEVRGSLVNMVAAPLQNFVIEKFINASKYYQKMQTSLEEQLNATIPQKEPDMINVLVASDRHDQINMDPMIGLIGQKTEADVFVDLGDDSSSGYEWERFSINSLDYWTKKIPNRVFVHGNHDSKQSDSWLRDAGFIDMNGMKVKNIAGLNMIGSADPEKSDLGMQIQQGKIGVSEVGSKLASSACASDKTIQLAIGHDPRQVADVAVQGCAQVNASGHLHREIDPTEQTNANGTVDYTFTNGTTGGAQAAISIGPLSNPANITELTYKIGVDKQPQFYGWRIFSFATDGQVTVGDFMSANPTITKWDLPSKQASALAQSTATPSATPTPGTSSSSR